MATVICVTGLRGAGKSTLCSDLAKALPGVLPSASLSGIFCPGIFDEANEKVGILAKNVKTGEERTVATKRKQEEEQDTPLATAHFVFDEQAMAWAGDVLQSFTENEERISQDQVYFVDELGPLELKKGKGWVGALQVLKEVAENANGQEKCQSTGKEHRTTAVVVIRESLLDHFQELLRSWNPFLSIQTLRLPVTSPPQQEQQQHVSSDNGNDTRKYALQAALELIQQGASIAS